MRTLLRGLGWVGLLWLLGMAACRAPASGSAVQVRIRNETGRELTELRLGTGGDGGSPESYGRIAVGETTDYRPIPPFLTHYRRLAFVTTDGTRHALTVYPEQHLGMRELPAGRYTFVLSLKDERPVLRIDAESRY